MAAHQVLAYLKDWGCDIAGAIERFADNEEFYLSYLPLVAKERAFEQLNEALGAGDATRAFESAHLLKGLIGNMGLTPLYKECCTLTEILRRGQVTGEAVACASRMTQLLDEYKKILLNAGMLNPEE